LTPLMVVGLLNGCAETHPPGPAALLVWIQNERAKQTPLRQPLSEMAAQPALAEPPAPVLADVSKQPQAIGRHSPSVELFNPQRLLLSRADDTPAPVEASSLTALFSQTHQARPPLDALPLAGMRLVGSLQRGGEALAMLRVNGLIYSVRVGDKIGQDQGRVSAITLSDLVLRELALNAAGQPTERVVSLALVPEP
jgi:type IV pilus assembly protein PilP